MVMTTANTAENNRFLPTGGIGRNHKGDSGLDVCLPTQGGLVRRAAPRVGRAGRRVAKGHCSYELPSLTRRIDAWKSEYPDGHITVGIQPGARSIMMANNDYLALGNHREIAEAQIEALHHGNADTFMSSVFVQFLDQQQAYEKEMAELLGAEAVALCQSGWAANDGLIQAIADEDTPVYIDLYAHASLWQGIHSAGAKPRPFRHNNLSSLRTLLRRYGPGIIVVDSIYSTSGDICPLEELVDLAEEHGCMLIVDESHGMGVVGEQGEGLVSALGLQDRVHFRTFSLSKAFVGRGGIVAGTARVMEFFRYQSRPAIFSSTVLPHETAGFRKTLEVVRRDNWRRIALKRNAAYLRGALTDLGFNVGEGDAPIIALVAGTEERTAQLRAALEERDVFGAVFCAPATPKNRALVRLTVNCGLTRDELDRVIDVCAELRDDLLEGTPALRDRRARPVQVNARRGSSGHVPSVLDAPVAAAPY